MRGTWLNDHPLAFRLRVSLIFHRCIFVSFVKSDRYFISVYIRIQFVQNLRFIAWSYADAVDAVSAAVAVAVFAAADGSSVEPHTRNGSFSFNAALYFG